MIGVKLLYETAPVTKTHVRVKQCCALTHRSHKHRPASHSLTVMTPLDIICWCLLVCYGPLTQGLWGPLTSPPPTATAERDYFSPDIACSLVLCVYGH